MRSGRMRDAGVRRRVRSLVAGAGVALALSFISGCSWTRSVIYDPEPDEARAAPVLQTGEFPLEEVGFVSDDGTRLHARLARFPGATRALLLCHGTGGNVARYTGLARALRDRARVHVLVFDYRGYGRSEGEPDETGLGADARAALDVLTASVGVGPARTVVVGHSLGGAVAIDLAASRPGLGGLVVLSSFTSMEDMCRHLTLLACLSDLIPDSWESRAKVRAVACPKLFLHGADDAFVPVEQGERLYEIASPPKQIVVFEDCGHEIWEHDRTLSAIASFVDAVAPEPGQERSR